MDTTKVGDELEAIKSRQWLINLRKAQDELIKKAQDNIRRHDEEHKQKKTTGEKLTEFPDGSYVLSVRPANITGQRKPSKLDCVLVGPYKVISHNGEEYKLQDLVRARTFTRTIHLLQPFYFDEDKTDPIEVALKDSQDAYEAEQVISHKGSLLKKKQVTFQVRWIGYDEMTTEPWSNVKDCIALHAYLRSIGQARHIPRKFSNDDDEANV